MISSRSLKLELAQANLHSISSAIFWSCMCWLVPSPTAAVPSNSAAKLRCCATRRTPAFDLHHYHYHSSDRLPPRLADGSFRFRYVITDYVAANVQAMMARPAFAQFVSMGILDFAEYGMCMLTGGALVPLRVMGACTQRTVLHSLANFGPTPQTLNLSGA